MSDKMCALVALLLVALFAAPTAAQNATSTQSSSTATGEVITLGADTEILRDDFSIVGYWGVTSDDAATIEYIDGALRFGLAPLSRWTWREVGAEAPTLWARASLDMKTTGGAAGPMCGVGGASPVFLFGVATTNGEWVVGRIVGDDLTVLERGPLPPSIDIGQGGRAIVSLECAMIDGSGDRVAVWVDGVNVGDVNLSEAIGPFSLVGLFGEGYVEDFEVVVDDVVVATGARYDPRMRVPGNPPPAPAPSPAPVSPAPSITATASASPLGDLIGHVPAAFRPNCTAAQTDPPNGVLEALLCTPAGDIESAGYLLYDSVERLDSAFEALLVSKDADTDGTDCSVGPVLVDYTVGDQTAGRLACYWQGDDAFIQWSNRDLLIMGIGAKSSGDFEGLFEWWQDAGPLP